MAHPPCRRLTLVGYRGSGKSTLGRDVAAILGRRFVDADEALVGEAGISIAEIFAREGEAGFRRRESACLAAILAAQDDLVLATGGGAVLLPGNRELLRRRGGFVVYLEAPPAVLIRRLEKGSSPPGARPSLTGRPLAEEVPMVLALRDPLYRATADGSLGVDGAYPEILAALVQQVRTWEASAHGPGAVTR